MKNLMFSFLLLGLCNNLSAQFVTIPDVNFRNQLIRLYPACFNANQEMDTTCSAVVNATSLSSIGSNIQNFDGLQYFDRLTTFDCSFNSANSLPTLPSGLTRLDCKYNQMVNLPPLPNGLVELACRNNRLTSLPELPNGLTILDCYNNKLTSLPTLPNGITRLACFDNLLTSLPVLPNRLTVLDCSTNQLNSLPALPSTLTGLDCEINRLTSLPALPNSLRSLDCSNNLLTSLPALPSSLGYLACLNNPLLSCLPPLPDVQAIYLSGTAITCMPNHPRYTSQANAQYPLCTNSNQICQTNPMARGVIYRDVNNNGIRDASENSVGAIPVITTPDRWTNVSDPVSGYLIKLGVSPITNTISVGNVPYRTFSPSSYSVNTSSLGLLPTTYDFAMQVTQPNVTDLVTRISTRVIRPGFQTTASVNVENIGTIDQTNASISLSIPNGLSVLSTTPPNGVVNGNVVTWSGESIAVFAQKSYTVSLQVPATMQLGARLTYTAQAIPSSTDFTADNNFAQGTVVVTGSYDPNDKLVNKDRLPNNYVAADEEMLYTIRFQNTGTDTAFTVLVRDTLDLAKLDFSTFRVTGASHTLRTNVRDHGVLEFVFNNINLPDSFVNEPLSHGYVQFRIHPKANLPLGTQIKNRAFIYFDFNTPIITDFATTTVGLLSVSSAELGAGSLSLYPVPVAEQLTVKFNAVRSGEVRYRLLDLQGRLLQEQQISVVGGENISTMDMGQLGAGMYLLQVVGEQGSVSSKIVKE